MRENKFEKNVQHQMEDFQLRPSEDVWLRVAEELRRKKRRRVAVIFFLLAGLGLIGYTGSFLFPVRNGTPAQSHTETKGPVIALPPAKQTTDESNTDNTNTQQDSNSENKPATPSTNKDADPALTPTFKPGEGKLANPETDNPSFQRNQSENPVAVTKNEPSRNNTPGFDHPRKQPGAKVVAGRKKSSQRNTDGNDVAGNPTDITKADVSPTVAPTDSNPTIAQVGPNEKSPSIIVTDSVMASNPITDSAEVAKKDEVLADSALTAPVIAKTSKKKIRWGLEFSVGQSDRRSKKLPKVFGATQEDGLLNANPNANPAPIFYSPSKPEATTAFTASVIGELQLGKRTYLTAGLRYSYMGDRITTGRYRDTTFMLPNLAAQYVAVNAVYRGVPEVEYTNRYHFIQVPVRFEWQVNRSKKIPVRWNIGASLGYLFHSDALMYDTALNGIYYKDKLAYTKTHFNLMTGFSIHSGSRSRIQWSIGPEINLDMSQLYKDTYDPRRFLMYGGVTGRIYFSR